MNIKMYINRALAEDIYPSDLTTGLLISPGCVSRAQIIAKEGAVLCGVNIARAVFARLDPRVKFKAFFHDGDFVKKGRRIALIKGQTRALLTGERVALNFLSHLSAIATTTHRFAQKIKPYKTRIFDTRKTTPGLRELEKYAVRCGGGSNHRFTLNDWVLIKDNHHLVLGSRCTIKEMVLKIRKKTNKPVEVEAESLPQFKKALQAGADIILLDNMRVAQMGRCLKLLKKWRGRKPAIEASGGIHLGNVKRIARLGVERISVGALTHSVKAIDVSMEILEQ